MTKRQLWQQRIEQWQQSQLSQKQWCEQQQIKIATFNYWRKKFRTDKMTSPSATVKSPCKFIALPSLPAVQSLVTLILPGHIKLQCQPQQLDTVLPSVLQAMAVQHATTG